MVAQGLVGVRLRRRKHQCAGGRLVAVGLEVRERSCSGLIGRWTAVLIQHVERGSPQGVGGVVGSEIGAVAKDGPVLHQPIAQEDLLAGDDVGASEQRGSAGINDRSAEPAAPLRSRRRRACP